MSARRSLTREPAQNGPVRVGTVPTGMLAGELIMGGFAAQGALGSHAKDPWDRFTGELDRLHCEFRKGETIYRVTAELFEAAAAVLSAGGEKIAERLKRAASHPISEFVYQCPFTRHSFEKPRGYAGDAELMDYIYGHPSSHQALARATPIGRAIFVPVFDCPAAAAVRARRNIIAGMIGDTVSRAGRPRILSVACGNARELEVVDSSALGQIEEFVGFDQDEISLSTAARHRIGERALTTVQGTILELMKDQGLADFDLIYAAGLFDYLSARVCRRLTANLFARLRSGGRLLVANFVPGGRDAGYLQAFMDWRLIYRTKDDILDFASGLVACELRRTRYFIEPSRNIGFLEIEKA
jgi:extracellular factor (EF) 3-hydroxypalmitic acid methyl ester biosynthesis protein